MTLKILIVEDQPAVREVVAEIAGELSGDVEVTQVGSLEEARSALCSQAWSGVITDMSLGDGNALEMMAALKQEGVVLPPTILMSGFLTSARMEQAVDLGIEHVLPKPFAPDVLLSCLNTMLSASVPDISDGKLAHRAARSSDRLLPEMFEMDRRLGLVYRMFDEMPARQDVSEVCASALNLAMEVVHADGGYLALFERQQHQLVQVATEGMGSLPRTCHLDETIFHALISGDEELIQSASMRADLRTCWPGMREGRFVAVPVRLQGVSMGVLCLLHPAEVPLKGETRQMLGLLVKKLDTLLDNRAVHAALAANMRETLIALVRTLEARDRYTRDHSARVGGLAAILARDLGLDDDHIDLIRTGGLLHDIGKCGVPDAVLLKPGRYTDQEFAIMKAHPAIGDNILANMDTMVRERLMLRHHHERYDGYGYPDRLAGEGIPFDARIVCVADAIDAMTTHRVYRMAQPLSFCVDQLKAGSGTQFDPQVVEVAIAAIERGVVRTQAEALLQQGDSVMPLSALISVKTEVRKYA
ncbi:HD domain-containing phosphohydrolase [Mariprofundus erugo]|uniref:HD domain-containing phosphohydrolase n=1 Tax=Mariprofundus erugo TaxID=2528639 RepID=UPI001EE99825|nr:HD domain-containing phosphohydrolase [Mariprofundus erugo]